MELAIGSALIFGLALVASIGLFSVLGAVICVVATLVKT